MARNLFVEQQFDTNIFVVLIAVLTTLLLILFFIFSCAEGAEPKEKDAAADSNIYGSGCAAGCGAACGG